MSDRDQRQKVVAAWAAEAFGVEQATSLPQRGTRLLEEAVEAAQSAGTTREMAHKLVDYVFDRPAGELGQEVGGVSVTLLALCAAASLSADEQEQREIARILSKPRDHYTKRNQAKNDAGFLATGDAPAAGAVYSSTWREMASAPKNEVILVYCPPYAGLDPLVSLCRWHEDAGFCVDELRTPYLWTLPPACLAKDLLSGARSRPLQPSDLPPGDTVIDYGGGMMGPLMLHWSTEGDDVVHQMKEAGFDCLFLDMADDLDPDHQLCVDHFEYGASDTLTKWTPSDQGDGWKLVGKNDSEDGPVALFVRPLPQQEPANG